MVRPSSYCAKCDYDYNDTEAVCPFRVTLVDQHSHCGLVVVANAGWTDYTGTTIAKGRFRLVSCIVQAETGAVYIAKDTANGQRVVVKILPKELLTAVEQVNARLPDSLAARVIHPYIVTVLDNGKTESGDQYVAMEYVEGRLLSHVLQEQAPLSFRRALSFGMCMLEAVQAVHALGILHCDLSPQNIFVVAEGTESESIKIIDFGIAQVVEGGRKRASSEVQIYGTPEYMAPEQVTSSGDIDGRADVYAIGAILYHAVTRQLPITGDTLKQVMAKKVLQTPQSPKVYRDDIPSELETAIMTALQLNKDDRFVSAEDFLVSLREAYV